MKNNDDGVSKVRKQSRDSYWDGDKMIMTERYHLKRGSCCGSGCRHCPFWPPYVKLNKEIRDDIIL
jgi:hypothetical protein|tara:strand:+ start:6513 stop:6710 length:198 start_codon:yes stop_codon:yes gene_type:complete